MHQFCSPQVVSWDKFTCSNSLEPSFDNNSKLFEPPLPVLQYSVCIICNPYYRLIKSKFSLVSILSCLGCRFDFFDDNRDNLGQLLEHQGKPVSATLQQSQADFSFKNSPLRWMRNGSNNPFCIHRKGLFPVYPVRDRQRVLAVAPKFAGEG